MHHMTLESFETRSMEQGSKQYAGLFASKYDWENLGIDEYEIHKRKINSKFISMTRIVIK